MKIPALRSHIGNWTYYVATLNFEQISGFVSKIDDELHKSESLKDLIQRSITNNYLNIKDYILNQPELFFNSLVLAVYDDYPNWREIEFTYEDKETYQMGLLEFPGSHKIFPVDGQHRVEGIKAALNENPNLKNEQVAVIFIGHKNDEEGMERTRRLFTTLNRYAKPVSLDDIIALDEDDTVAIITRYLLEEYDLFTGKRIVYAKQKALPSNNKDAITSIITLYQSNIEIFKYYYQNRFDKKPTKKNIEKYLKFRPPQEDISAFQDFCVNYWNEFKTELSFISEYLTNEAEDMAQDFRNNETGGNLVFRPIGLLPLIKATISVKERTEERDFKNIFRTFNDINFDLSEKPWRNVAWNPKEKRMIMNSTGLVQLLYLYLYDKDILKENELAKLKESYASKVDPERENIEDILQELN